MTMTGCRGGVSLPKKKILIVDDQHGVRALLKLALKKYDLKEAVNGQEAIKIAENWQPDLILVDLKMPDMSGLDTISAIYKLNLNPRIVLMTAYNNMEMIQDSVRISGVISKPFDLLELVSLIDNILKEKPGT